MATRVPVLVRGIPAFEADRLVNDVTFGTVRFVVRLAFGLVCTCVGLSSCDRKKPERLPATDGDPAGSAAPPVDPCSASPAVDGSQVRVVGAEAAGCRAFASDVNLVLECVAPIVLEANGDVARLCRNDKRLVVARTFADTTIKGEVSGVDLGDFEVFTSPRNGYWGYIESGTYPGFGESPTWRSLVAQMRRIGLPHKRGQCGPLDTSNAGTLGLLVEEFTKRGQSNGVGETCLPRPWRENLWQCAFAYEISIGGGQTSLIISAEFSRNREVMASSVACSIIG